MIGSPEYFGYMSGLSSFFDRTYEAARGHVFRKPYAVFVNAGNDGTGMTHIERICRGFQFKKSMSGSLQRERSRRQSRCVQAHGPRPAGCAAGIY